MKIQAWAICRPTECGFEPLLVELYSSETEALDQLSGVVSHFIKGCVVKPVTIEVDEDAEKGLG